MKLLGFCILRKDGDKEVYTFSGPLRPMTLDQAKVAVEYHKIDYPTLGPWVIGEVRIDETA